MRSRHLSLVLGFAIGCVVSLVVATSVLAIGDETLIKEGGAGDQPKQAQQQVQAIQKQAADLDPCKTKQLVETKQTPFGECRIEYTQCDNKRTDYSCCICELVTTDEIGTNKITVMRASSGYTYSSCQQLCKQEDTVSAATGLGTKADIYRQLGAGVLPPDTAGQQGPTASEIQDRLKYCFTASDCASSDYGGSSDAFRPGYNCPAGQGRCIAPEPVLTLSNPIGNVRTVAGFRGFLATVFNYAVGIAAVAAAIMFVWGGFRYIFGSAFTSVQRAKEIMVDAAIGLVLTLGAMLILRTINPATLNLTRLEVFMINKEQILSENLCEKIKSEKPLLLADAGVRPSFTPLAQVDPKSFSIKPEDTKCNFEYYVQGFGDNRCKGNLCEQPGTACVSCRSGLCGASADKNAFGCVTASFTGTVGHDTDRALVKVSLIAMCLDVTAKLIKPPSEFTNQSDLINLRESFVVLQDGTISGESKGIGKQSYVFNVTAADITKVENECKNHGAGVVGFALGVQYHENVGYDDVAILGKNNCGSSAFAGYVNGNPAVSDVLMKNAWICAAGFGSKPLFQVSNMWSLKEIKASAGIGGTPEAISCNFDLNSSSAPYDPGTSLQKKYVISPSVGAKTECAVP
jgi:hypothetical protein